MSSWTGAGKAMKSRFETRPNAKASHLRPERVALEQYPTLGYACKATREREGEQGGGTGGSREVFPLARIYGRRQLRSKAGGGA